jgi:hypothetical protein
MSNRPECEECRALLDEFLSALDEIRVSKKLGDEMRARGEAFLRMLGGDENDAQLAEEIVGKFRPQLFGPPEPNESRPLHPRLQDAARRMSEHRLRTGHNILSTK